jgi:hypothetical protein
MTSNVTQVVDLNSVGHEVCGASVPPNDTDTSSEDFLNFSVTCPATSCATSPGSSKAATSAISCSTNTKAELLVIELEKALAERTEWLTRELETERRLRIDAELVSTHSACLCCSSSCCSPSHSLWNICCRDWQH